MATYTDALIVYNSGKLQKISAMDSVSISGSMSIGGNLNVQGDIVSTGAQNVLISDPFLDLSSGYTQPTGRSSGFTFNVRSTGALATVTDFYPGSISSPPSLVLNANGGTFLANDIIQISNAQKPENNGLYAIESFGMADTTVYLYGTGTGSPVPQYALFCQNQVTLENGSTAYISKVNLAALAVADGLYTKDSTGSLFAAGSFVQAYYAAAKITDFNGTGAGTGYTLVGSGSGGGTLQDAYDAGNEIELTDDRDFSISSPAAGKASIVLLANNVAAVGTEPNLSGVPVVTYAFSSDEVGVGLYDVSGPITASGPHATFTATGLTVEGKGQPVTVHTSGTVFVSGQAVDVSGVSGVYIDAFDNGFIRLGHETAPVLLGRSSTENAPMGTFLAVDGSSDVLAGNILYITNNSGTPKAVKADADGVGVVRELVGVALEADPGGGGGDIKVATVPGSIVAVKFASAPTGDSDIGLPVYLSTTAGEATMTAPTSGARVYRIGVLYDGTADGNGNYKVLYLPAFVADLS